MSSIQFLQHSLKLILYKFIIQIKNQIEYYQTPEIAYQEKKTRKSKTLKRVNSKDIAVIGAIVFVKPWHSKESHQLK